MANDRIKNLEGRSRRHFLRWMTTAGALLTLERSKVLDVIADTGGSAMADESCGSSNRSVHLVAGNGGLAWFQLLWPHVAVAAANNPTLAFHAPGSAIKAPDGDTDKPFFFAPETPWQGLDKTKRISAFMAGRNRQHVLYPESPSLDGGASMIAAAAAIQRATPSLVPVIGIGDIVYGAAASAPELVRVSDTKELIGLFNTSASKLILSKPEDAALFEAYYKAFVGLQKAARLPTWTRPLKTGKTASNLLGTQLAAMLAPTAADRAGYGIPEDDSTIPTSVCDIGEALITTAKAFKLGLTQCVIMPAMLDDPHDAFLDSVFPSTLKTVQALGKVLDGFVADLAGASDPQCAAKTFADTTILTVHGDLPKDPLDRVAWPDTTPGSSNWMYVLGNGYLKTGWFGGVGVDGAVTGFDPATGAEVAWPTDAAGMDATSAPVGAAVLFAISKGDMRRVSEFYTGPSIKGIVHENPIG
jgi:hypothetical protein